MVKQSLSWNIVRMSLLILFFFSIMSEVPFYSLSVFSRYSLELIVFPIWSLSLRAKSLTTHMNEGKYLEILSGSSSDCPDLTWISFERLMIKERF